MLYGHGRSYCFEPMRPGPAHAPAWRACWGIYLKISSAIAAAMVRPMLLPYMIRLVPFFLAFYIDIDP